MIPGPSTRDQKVTKPDFRPCSACMPHSQAPLCLCTLRLISNQPEGTFGRLRYLLGKCVRLVDDESLIAQLPIARKFRLSHHPNGMSGVQSLRGHEDFPADCPHRTHFHCPLSRMSSAGCFTPWVVDRQRIANPHPGNGCPSKQPDMCLQRCRWRAPIRGDRPSQTAHLAMSGCRITDSR